MKLMKVVMISQLLNKTNWLYDDQKDKRKDVKGLKRCAKQRTWEIVWWNETGRR